MTFEQPIIFLFKKEITSGSSNTKFLKNLLGYHCRVAVGKIKNFQNIYYVETIQGFVFKPIPSISIGKLSHLKVIFKFKNFTRSLKTNFLSSSFPKADEIVDFTQRRLSFDPKHHSEIKNSIKKTVGNSIKFSRIKKGANGPKIRKLFNGFLFSGSNWKFIF